MHEVFDLDGTNFVRGRCQPANGKGIEIQLTIAAPSGFGEGGYYPAESITLNDLMAVEALGDLCEKIVREHAAIKAQQRALAHNGPDISLEPSDDDDDVV